MIKIIKTYSVGTSFEHSTEWECRDIEHALRTAEILRSGPHVFDFELTWIFND